MSEITIHVLDTSIGRPAAGVAVVLELEATAGNWTEIGRGTTNTEGRLMKLVSTESLVQGIYRLTFETEAYFRSKSVQSFYPCVTVIFRVRDPRQNYHIPLLVSPYGYSTYRGS